MFLAEARMGVWRRAGCLSGDLTGTLEMAWCWGFGGRNGVRVGAEDMAGCSEMLTGMLGPLAMAMLGVAGTAG